MKKHNQLNNSDEGLEIPRESEEQGATTPLKRGLLKYILSPHVLFLVVIIVIVILIINRLSNWGEHVDMGYINNLPDVERSERESYDSIVPLIDEETGNLLATKSPHNILLFGNSTLAQGRNSKNGIANLIAEKTGSTIYNCAVADSLLASHGYTVWDDETGLNVYNFYWLCIYLARHNEPDVNYFDWLAENPKSKILPETDHIRQTLETIDMSTIDTIGIMYDAADYFAGSPCPETCSTDPTTFAGNLEAGIQVLQTYYPNIRIIVMSPTYAFGVNENGEYVSSDKKTYNGSEVLSNFMLRECQSASLDCGVSFIDHIYGTFNEDEASEYLSDNYHLNQAGIEKVADRFAKALTAFDK